MEEKNKLALIVAYYLSKYDRGAVSNLGYSSFTQAFHSLGEILNVKHSTIKQMREQFDPYHENPRVGWYQRPLSRSRRDVMNQYGGMSEGALNAIVKEIINDVSAGNSVAAHYTQFIQEDEHIIKEKEITYTTRGETGKKAEELFLELYAKGEIMGFTEALHDTREQGTGYDFMMKAAPHFIFEVKGLKAATGGVLFTDKEWEVAKAKGDQYFLVLLSNLDVSYEISVIQNPYEKLDAKLYSYPAVNISWHIATEEIFSLTNP